jgi:DNA-binding CsgD family transcriptional regulator
VTAARAIVEAPALPAPIPIDSRRLLERERELEQIAACLDRAHLGHGGALALEGPAGIGKTAVLTAGRALARSEGFRVLRARGAELEREFPFGVVRQLFEGVLAEASDGDRASLLAGAAGRAARVLGLPHADAQVGAAAPITPDPSFAVLHGLYWLTAHLAAERPLALAVDDAHWADPASLRFLAFLVPRLEELGVAVLFASRPVDARGNGKLLAALTTDPGTEVVSLAPLTTGAVSRLVATTLSALPDAGFVAACREATGGVPFLVRTLVESLRRQQAAAGATSAPRVQDLATAGLGRWACLQIGQLGSDAERLGRAVAILERAELRDAALLADIAPDKAAETAADLVRAGVLHDGPLAFAHPILRAAVYGEIAAHHRSEAHGRAARLLADEYGNADRVAEHLLAASPRGDGWVVDQLAAVARSAAASGAPESAATYLRRALAEPPRPEARPALLRDLGLAEFSADQEGWQHHLEAAVSTTSDDELRVTVALQLATALCLHARLAEAVELLDRVAAGLDDRDPQSLLVVQATAVACGLMHTDTAPSVARRTTALLAAAEEPSVPRATLGVAAYATALANEPAEKAVELARRAVAAGPRPLPIPEEPPWFANATMALLWAERYDEVQTLLDASVAEARAASDALTLPAVLAQRALLGVRRGDLSAAEADAHALLDAPDRQAPLLHRLLASGALVDAFVERGELDQAERTIEPLRAELETPSLTASVLRHGRGRLRLAQRRFAEALCDFQAVGEIARRTGAISPCRLPWRSDAALAHHGLGDVDAARRLSQEEVDLARAFGAPRALGMALRVAGLVTGGRRGETDLREAIEVLDGSDTRLEQARALTDLGALLRRSKRRADARELLRRALDVAHRAGARPLADRADTELRATGARPRRVVLTGLESLTASERRVAELAADGLTNPDIGQHLFVTARTVEGHLTHVFQKLDIKTRRELPMALGTAGTSGR